MENPNEKKPNIVLRVAEKAAYLLGLNLLTLLCILPIFTAGSSLTAMDYCLLKLVRNEEGYLLQDFFKSFKNNLKQGIQLTIFYLILFLILGLNFYLSLRTGSTGTIRLAAVIAACLISLHSIYTFAGLSRYEGSLKTTLKNGMVLAVYHLPQSLLILFLVSSLVLLLISFSIYLFPFFLMFGLSLPGYIIMGIISGLFKKEETT